MVLFSSVGYVRETLLEVCVVHYIFCIVKSIRVVAIGAPFSLLTPMGDRCEAMCVCKSVSIEYFITKSFCLTTLMKSLDEFAEQKVSNSLFSTYLQKHKV